MKTSRFHLIAPLVVLSMTLGAVSAFGNSPSTASLLESIGFAPVDQTQLLKPNGEPLLESEPNSPGADWLMDQRSGKRSTISRSAYQRALTQAARADERTAQVAPEVAGAEWELLGPTNIGGRVAEVAIDPLAQDTVYAATASGGVWKSVDAGANWTYSWDPDITQALGALAVTPDGTLFAGTGESNPGGGSITYGGAGIYRSTDHGATWEFVGLRQSGAFGRIVVDPANPERIFAAASGDLYKKDGDRGLYLSEDGGDHWTRVLEGENGTTGAADVAIDPANPDNILVGMWDHERVPAMRLYAGVGSGVWRSTDGGETFTEISIPHGLTEDNVGRIGVAFAPSDPNRAYAYVANNLAGSGVGMFRSDDGGATFTKTAVAGGSLSQSSFGWWFGRIWVDPANRDTVWIPGVSLLRSTNGGDSFSGVSGVHADQHAMAWDPKVPNRVYLGNDGGMYRSDNNGSSWIGATSQGWTQHYSVDVGELNPDHVVTGLQDNGCNKNWDSEGATGPGGWVGIGCGDGLETLINPTHEKTLYACSQYGACSILIDGAPVGPPMVRADVREGWWTPIIFDPTNSNTMYFGSNMVERSLNGGLTFTAISPDLSKNETQTDPHTGYKIRGVVTAIAASKSTPGVVWAGTDDGQLWKSTDAVLAQPTWTKQDYPGLSETWITRVAIDPADANVVYVTFSGYREGVDAARILKTTNGGSTWTDISTNLPAAPVNDIIVAGDQLVAATDVGVFISDAVGNNWLRLGADLPVSPVIELRYHQATNTITAATFGHGIRRTTLP